MTALFLTVCNAAIAAGWVVLGVMLLRLLLQLPELRRVPRWCVCLLWAVVGLRLLIPFSLESTWSLLPHAELLTETLLYDPTPTVHTGVPALNTVINESVMSSLASNPGYSVNPLQVITAVGSWVWVIGAGLMVLYMVISYLHLYSKLRFAVRCEGENNVYECETVSSPFVLGLFRPRIYLPYRMDEETRAHVIAHERAHLARGDQFLKPAAFLLLSVYWFQPLLWAAYVLLCRDIEAACDESAAKHYTAEERKAYAAALVRCAVHRRAVSACPLAFGESGIRSRVRAVLDYKKPTVWILSAAVVMLAVFAVCFGTNPPAQRSMTVLTEYDTAALVYDNGMFSYVQTVETAPSFAMDDDGMLWMCYPHNDPDGWTSIGVLSDYTLTEENFDAMFTEYSDGMSEDALPATLRRQSRAVMRAVYTHPAVGNEDIYTLLPRENGDLLLLYSFRTVTADGALSDEIPRWIFRLTETQNSVRLPEYGSYRVAYAYAGSPAPDYNEIHWMPYADQSADMMTSIPDRLDKDRLRGASGIPVLRFESADDLRQFRKTYRDAFVFDDSNGTIPSFDYAVKSFGDSQALFRDNVLLAACINAPSGSHVFSVSQITAEDGVLAVDIDRYVPELCTDDEISHFVLIAVPRTIMEMTEAVLVLVEYPVWTEDTQTDAGAVPPETAADTAVPAAQAELLEAYQTLLDTVGTDHAAFCGAWVENGVLYLALTEDGEGGDAYRAALAGYDCVMYVTYPRSLAELEHIRDTLAPVVDGFCALYGYGVMQNENKVLFEIADDADTARSSLLAAIRADTALSAILFGEEVPADEMEFAAVVDAAVEIREGIPPIEEEEPADIGIE